MFLRAVVCLSLFAGFVSAEPPKKTDGPGKPVEVTLEGLKSVVPITWKVEKPDNLLRAYQFKLPKADGDKEDATLFVLTTVQGTPEENITRLKDLFVLPTSLSKEKAVREWKMKNPKATLTCIDVQGTYYVKNKPIDKAVKEVRPDYRMIGAIWVGKDASYSIRLVGPKNTVERHAKSFEDWLKNFK